MGLVLLELIHMNQFLEFHEIGESAGNLTSFCFLVNAIHIHTHTHRVVGLVLLEPIHMNQFLEFHEIGESVGTSAS